MRDANWFGAVTRDGTKLDDAGLMVECQLEQLPDRFSSLEIDAHIIMPDHVHAAFVLHDNADGELNSSNRRGEPCVRPATPPKPADTSGATVVDRSPVAQGDDKHRPYENPRGTLDCANRASIQIIDNTSIRRWCP
jgi:hypothetical protein